MWISPYWEFSDFQTIFSAHVCCYCSVISYSLRPHGLQHAGLPCPSLSLRVFSNSCPSSQWCHPAILSSATHFSSCPQLSQHQGLFQWVSSLHQVAKELELQHQPFQSGLISFRIVWFDLLAVQGTLKSLLQHHNSKASIRWPTCGWWKVD